MKKLFTLPLRNLFLIVIVLALGSVVSAQPVVSIITGDAAFTEAIGAVCFSVNISNANGNATDVDVVVSGTSTATNGVDFTYSPTTVNFPASYNGNMSVCVSFTDDAFAEPLENFTLKLTNTTNGAGINDTSINFLLYDNDSITNANPCTEPFITEYVHSISMNSHAIEIYNPNSAPINLSNYSLKLFYDGASSAGNTIALSGTLNYGDVYIVAEPSSDASILAIADLTSSFLNFTGNDAVGLYHNSTLLDVIGNIGQDPGLYWPAGNMQTASATIVRNIDVFAGETSWDVSAGQWTGYAQDDFSHLGSHTINGCGFVVPPVISMITTDAVEPEDIGAIGMQVGIDMPPTVDATIDLEIDNASTATLTDDYTIDQTTLTFPTGTTTSQGFGISIVDDAATEGDETVIVKLRNVSGAELGDSVFVLTITDNDGIGISPLSKEQIMIFPNPASDVIKIFSHLYAASACVYDVLGNKVIADVDVHATEFEIPVQQLAEGCYVLELKTESGSLRQTFVKRR